MNRGHCSEPAPAAFMCRPAADADKQRLDDMEEAHYLRVAAVTLSQAFDGERVLQQMFVWLQVHVGLECCGEGPAGQLREDSHVSTQRAALALASFWDAPSLKQKQIYRLTKGSTVGYREPVLKL